MSRGAAVSHGNPMSSGMSHLMEILFPQETWEFNMRNIAY